MVGVNSSYNYYQSQVPQTFGTNNYNNNNIFNNTSTYGNDTFSIDNTSKAFDEAMARLTGKPVFNANTTSNNVQNNYLPAGITQQELNWALELENKVRNGYKPTPQETSAYQALATKMSNSQTNNNFNMPINTTQVTAPTQEEINWALELENKVKSGYTPNAQETAKYQDIANRLQASQSSKISVTAPTQEEINWALELENKVKSGYTPNAQETAKYQDIANRLQASQSSKTSVTAPTQEEINWALELENKVKSGYTPNAQETAKYQDIANRLQASQNTSSGNNRDWTAWSQPFSVPRSIFQTTPRIIQVPATLRKMNSNIPVNTSVNVGPSLNNNPTVSNDEIQWALNLENRVKNGYNPTEAELYQYKQIADKLQAMKNGGNTNNIQNNQNIQNKPKTSFTDRLKNAWNALLGK
ncbi:MAG: hypothetical protein KatS3mg068_1846 [Candidatus Sericytochromatia bacterium]|nr:MAG: hypothetical protein KatS3mg068_1846 [Candidatus Sericytochromatia bacterium]